MGTGLFRDMTMKSKAGYVRFATRTFRVYIVAAMARLPWIIADIPNARLNVSPIVTFMLVKQVF